MVKKIVKKKKKTKDKILLKRENNNNVNEVDDLKKLKPKLQSWTMIPKKELVFI